MQLQNQLSNFKNKNMLLFVAGKQDAKIYHINGTSIEEIINIYIPRPEYSDNEGIFQSAPNGRHVSGSVELRQDENVIREFIHEFQKATKDLKVEFDEIYYSAPDMSRTWIRDAMPREWQQKITHTKEGNFLKESVTDLLEKFAKEDEKPFVAESKEEEKLLSIPKQ